MPDHEEGKQGAPRQFKTRWSSSVHFSSPLPRTPRVCWRYGSTPEIIIEMWLDAQYRPAQRHLAFLLGKFKRIVIYHRDRPHIRAEFDLGDLKAAKRQEIVGWRLEGEGLPTKQVLREAADLLEEFARVEERGRPRGTGHPKRRPHQVAGLSGDDYLKWKQSGLTGRQILALTLWSRCLNQVNVARELDISASAVCQLLDRAEKEVQKKNPGFSLSKFKLAQEQVGSGLRWNRRPVKKDEFGRPYVRDLSQEIERPTRGRTRKRDSRK